MSAAEDRAEPGHGDHVDLVSFQGVDDPMGVGDPVEAGPEALPLDDLDRHPGGLGQLGGRAGPVDDDQRRRAGRRRGWRPGSVPVPDARTPSRGAGESHEDASRHARSGPTLSSWPASPTCSPPGGRTRSSSSPRRATPSTPAWSRRCWTLQPLRPSFVSVTYRGGRSSRQRTHDLVVGMLRTTTLTPMAHLICVAHTRLELAEILVDFRKAGVENLMALGGDPPTDPDAAEGELDHAVELVELARAIGGFSIGVAAHPAGHPRSPDMAVRPATTWPRRCALADFAVTQFFFRAEEYLGLVDDLAGAGISTPVVPGIMPVTSLSSIGRMAEMGAAVPADMAARLEAAGRRRVCPPGRHRDGHRPVPAAARRRGPGPALLHAQPLAGDQGDLRQPGPRRPRNLICRLAIRPCGPRCASCSVSTFRCWPSATAATWSPRSPTRAASGCWAPRSHSPEQLDVELSWIDEHTGERPYGADILVPEKVVGRGREPERRRPGRPGAGDAPRVRGHTVGVTRRDR